MGLFSRKKEEQKAEIPEKTPATSSASAAAPEKTVKNDTKSQSAATKSKKKKSSADGALAHGVIIAPVVSEKSHALTDQHVYTFRVHKSASKDMVQRAVEGLYGVDVKAVRMINMPKRKRTIGRNQGYRSALRKALVRVAPGDKIDVFEGVS